MGLSSDEQLAKALVGATLTSAAKNTADTQADSPNTAQTDLRIRTPSVVTFAVSDSDEEIEEIEEIEEVEDVDVDVEDQTNGHGTESDSSSSTSSSSNSSNSSSKHSSVNEAEVEMTIQPTRLAQTFSMKDLSSELDQTRTISKPDRSNTSISLKKQSRSKLNTWIKPKNDSIVIETDGGDNKDKVKLKEWISEKDAKAIEDKREKRRLLMEEKKNKLEEDAEKKKLEGVAFERWESKKRDILLEKIRKSDELKKKRQEKAAEMREKKAMNEKMFASWKNNKETTIAEQKKAERDKKKEEEEDKRIEEVQKERMQKAGFKKWCDKEKELQTKKKAAQKAALAIEAEIKMLEDFRKAEAEEEFLQWKKEKSVGQTEIKRAEHPLGWAPAGNSKGEHRHSPKAVVPGAPLSRTLAALKSEQPRTRTLKTIDVCCRKISFWCHCPEVPSQEPQYYSSVLSSPRSSQPTSPASSRPSTPISGAGNSRPYTPVSENIPRPAAPSNGSGTPQRSYTGTRARSRSSK